MTGGWTMPPDASAEGWRIDELLGSSLLSLGLLAIVSIGYIAWAVIAWRRGKPPHSWGRSKGAIALVIAITTIIFIAVDVRMFSRATRDFHTVLGPVNQAERETGSVRIEVNAQRWAWNMRLAGLDGTFATDDDIVVLNHMRVPLGRAVIVQLSSSDVIHSFFAPALRVRLDAVPGRVQSTWFRPTELGTYEIACTQFCGVYHHQMRGTIEVVSEKDFVHWQQQASREAVAIAAEDRRALADEPTRPVPEGDNPVGDSADARRWGWPWSQGAGR